MLKARTMALLLVSFWCIAPAQSQALMEGTFVRSLGAGAGAGAAASMGHGKVVRRTAESMLQAQQAMLAQTKAIEQYVATGVQLTAKKQWASAEQYFQEALKVIAKRDGPGSPKSVPVLTHLAKVSKNQHKLDEAIGYQKTVVAFANAGKAQNPTAAVQAQVDLSNLYMDKGDLTNAEGVLKQSADIVRSNPSIPPKTYSATLKVYGSVLRKLNKEAEAETIDQELAAKGEASGTAAATVPTEPVQSAVTSTAPQAVPSDASAAATTAPGVAVAPGNTATDGAPSTTTDTSATNAALDLTAPSATPAAPAAAAAPADASTPQTPPAGMLPPPTADWPVMNSDGKIVSEESTAPADTPPATSAPAGETKSAPAATQPTGETGAAPAAPATSQPAESAPAVAPPSAAASPAQPAEIK